MTFTIIQRNFESPAARLGEVTEPCPETISHGYHAELVPQKKKSCHRSSTKCIVKSWLCRRCMVLPKTTVLTGSGWTARTADSSTHRGLRGDVQGTYGKGLRKDPNNAESNEK